VQAIGETKSAGWATGRSLNEALVDVGGEGLGEGVGDPITVGMLEWTGGVGVADGEDPVQALTRRMSATLAMGVAR